MEKENTCGAHEEECTNWCNIHKRWECDQCYSIDYEERNRIYQEKYKKFEHRRNFFLAKIKAWEDFKL